MIKWRPVGPQGRQGEEEPGAGRARCDSCACAAAMGHHPSTQSQTRLAHPVWPPWRPHPGFLAEGNVHGRARLSRAPGRQQSRQSSSSVPGERCDAASPLQQRLARNGLAVALRRPQGQPPWFARCDAHPLQLAPRGAGCPGTACGRAAQFGPLQHRARHCSTPPNSAL